jgi:hypothetical protein
LQGAGTVANAAHGQRRTNADKRKAVITLLEDAEWGRGRRVKSLESAASVMTLRRD